MAENYLIHLKKLINSDVALLRSLGDVIRENTAKKFSGQKVEVDFSEIRSISRAFAHELLTLKNDPELKGSSIHIDILGLTLCLKRLVSKKSASTSKVFNG